MIRREDVRQTEKDRVELSKCFRPSDIVLATIISLGDQSNYLLSTAGDSLGTVNRKNTKDVNLYIFIEFRVKFLTFVAFFRFLVMKMKKHHRV